MVPNWNEGPCLCRTGQVRRLRTVDSDIVTQKEVR